MQQKRKFYLLLEIVFILISFILLKYNEKILFNVSLGFAAYCFVSFILPEIPVFFKGFFAFLTLFFFILAITFTNLNYGIPNKYPFSINYFYIYIAVIFTANILTLIYTSKLRIFNITSCFFLTILFFVFLYFAFNNNIHVVNYSTKTNGLLNKEIKIAMLSDTHSTIFPNDDLVLNIKNEKPDLILLTGDIIDDLAPIKGTDILMDKIKDIAPIYYCTGNHEYMVKDYDKRIENLKKYGINYLNDEYKTVNIKGNEILLAGVNDPLLNYVKKDYPSIKSRLNNLENEYSKLNFKGLKILLSHRPELHDLYANYHYDLVLSGHAHGGQVRIPFILNGFVAPNQGFFPKYAGGEYTLNYKTKMIVSRGLSIGPLPRVFNPPELVIITIK